MQELADRVVDAVWGSGALYAVFSTGDLVELRAGEQRVLLSDAVGGLAILGDGTLIAVAGTGSETDLWRVDPRGFRRPLVVAPGRDYAPLALDDGRVAFISSRSGEPALYVVDPFGSEPRRLAPLAGDPLTPLAQEDGTIVFHGAAGEDVRVPLPSNS